MPVENTPSKKRTKKHTTQSERSWPRKKRSDAGTTLFKERDELSDLSEEEAKRLFVCWYPLATDEKSEQEETKDDKDSDLDQEEDEDRPLAEGEEMNH